MGDKSTLTYIFSIVGAFIGYFLGGFDMLVKALILFTLVDFVTGVMAGIIHKEVESRRSFKGIFKKVCIFLLVGVAHMLDMLLIQEGGSPLRTAVIFFYLSNEGISIIENVSRMDLDVPERLRKIMDVLKKDGT